jgi:hypothetical protein
MYSKDSKKNLTFELKQSMTMMSHQTVNIKKQKVQEKPGIPELKYVISQIKNVPELFNSRRKNNQQI